MTPESLSTCLAVCGWMGMTSLTHWDELQTTLVPRLQRKLGGGAHRASQDPIGGLPGSLWAPSHSTAGEVETLPSPGPP